MGNIAPRAGFKLAPFTFRANVLTITSPSSPSPSLLTSSPYLHLPTYLCGSLPERLVQTYTLVPLGIRCLLNGLRPQVSNNYIQAMFCIELLS